MRKVFIGAAVLAMAGMILAAGRPGVVRTKDGGVFDGNVEEGTENVTVNIRGIDTAIPRDRIESITYGDFESRWNEQYNQLEKTDVTGRIAAGRRAFDERRYDLAERALRDAQSIDPNNVEAAELLRLTINQRRMDRGSGSPDTPPAPRDSSPNPPVRPAAQWKLLSPDQINSIKQAQFKPSEPRLQVNFRNNVRKKFHDANPDLDISYSDFLKLSQAEQASQILRGGGDFAKDVIINSDPETIVAFRRDVLPLVTQGCATSSCHGGSNEASAKFPLVSPAPDAAATYTNFYVLQMKQIPVNSDGADFGKPTSAPMFDRLRPDQSLMIQYALPTENATLKHPTVRGYNGLFRNGLNDSRAAAVRNFISTLSPIEPDYGIDFKLQREGGNTTKPAGQ